MYTFICPETEIARLKEFSKKSTSIPSRVEELTTNPKARAKQTGIPIIGEYYINAGRFCILFNIDEEKEQIIILRIVYSSYLDKILTGWIEP